MATISKRGKRWYAQVRRKGFPAQFRTFPSKSEAAAWARAAEKAVADIDALEASSSALTVGELLQRYRDTVSVRKRGATSEKARLSNLIKMPMSALNVTDLKPAHVAAYRDHRRETGDG